MTPPSYSLDHYAMLRYALHTLQGKTEIKNKNKTNKKTKQKQANIHTHTSIHRMGGNFSET